MQQVYFEYLGNMIELPLGETYVGRDVDCGIRLDDASVSRRHLRVVRRESSIFVEDLDSRNGTLVNGQPITSAVMVHEGDIVTLSSRVFTVREDAIARAKRPTLVLDPGGRSESGPLHSEGKPRTSANAVTVPPDFRTQPVPLVTRRCTVCSETLSALDDDCPGCGAAVAAADSDRVASLRRHPRRALAVGLLYVSPELEIEVTSRDLSESGVFICSPVLDPIGTQCHLTLDLAIGPLGTHGVVRRVVEHGPAAQLGFGVEFVDLAPAERECLRDVIAHST